MIIIHIIKKIIFYFSLKSVYTLLLLFCVNEAVGCARSILRFEKESTSILCASRFSYRLQKVNYSQKYFNSYEQPPSQALPSSQILKDNFFSQVKFTPLSKEDIPTLTLNFAQVGWNKPSSIFEKYLEDQEKLERRVWLAFKDQVFLGYITLKYKSDYPPFCQKNTPEISDLNVLPMYRKHGLGNYLLSLAEQEAAERSLYVGLGVGLYSDYGEAQKIYVKRGYVPDGLGLSYNNFSVKPGSMVRVDDNLVLWFIKKLKSSIKT